MKRLLFLFIVLLTFPYSEADVNRMAVMPFYYKTPPWSDAPQIASRLEQLVVQYIAQKDLYKVISSQECKAVLNKNNIQLDQFYDLQTRDEALKKIADDVDYLVLASIQFNDNQMTLAVSISLCRVADYKVFKSTAIPGNRKELETLVSLLVNGIIPSTEDIIKEIQAGYTQSYAQKQYKKAIEFASWAIHIEPRHWERWYQRGLAYESEKAYAEAQDDYQQAQLFHKAPSPKISEAMERIKPQLLASHDERKNLLQKAGESIHKIEAEYASSVEILPGLLQDLARLYPENFQIKEKNEEAIRLKAGFAKLQEELRQIQGEKSDRKGMQHANAFLQSVEQYEDKVKEIIKFLGHDFEKTGNAYLEESLKLYKNGRYSQALLLLNKACLLIPKSAEVFYWRGFLLDKEGKSADALRNFNKAIRLNPNYAEAYYGRAMQNIKKNSKKAIEDLQNAVKINPKLTEAYFALAEIYESKKEPEKAIESHTQAIQLNPKYAPAYFRRGKLYDRQHEYAKAREDYRRALEFDPELQATIHPLLLKVENFINKDAMLYFNKARSCMDSGEIALAITFWNKALELNTDFGRAYFHRGFCYHIMGEEEKAVKDYTEALSIKRTERRVDAAELYYNRAISYQKLGRYSESIEDLEKAIEMNPTFHLAYHRRGLVWEEKKEYKKAAESLEQAIKVYPGRAYYYLDLARVYTALGNTGVANTHMMRARDLEK